MRLPLWSNMHIHKKWHLIVLIGYVYPFLGEYHISLKDIVMQGISIDKYGANLQNIIFSNDLCKMYDILFIEDLDINKMTYIKSAGRGPSGRTVYFDKSNNVYVKIWGISYFCTSFFLKALRKKFYDELAPLKCILIDREYNCRGYVTHSLKNYPLNLIGDSKIGIASAKYQNESYSDFLQLLQKRTQETGIIYYDLTMSNIACNGTDYFLIDLESVIDIPIKKELRAMFNRALKYNPIDYQSFINSIAR